MNKIKYAFLHKPSKKFLTENEAGMYMSKEPNMTFDKNDIDDYLEYIKECYMWDDDNKINTEDHPSKIDLDDIEIVEIKLKW
jgi:hypothetical protein